MVSEPDPKQTPDANQQNIKSFYKTIKLFYNNQGWHLTNKIKNKAISRL
jgi:hypothetical protein